MADTIPPRLMCLSARHGVRKEVLSVFSSISMNRSTNLDCPLGNSFEYLTLEGSRSCSGRRWLCDAVGFPTFCMPIRCATNLRIGEIARA